MDRSRLRMHRSENLNLPANSTSVENQFCRSANMGRQNGRGHIYIYDSWGGIRPPQTPPLSRPGGLQIWICILDVISRIWICMLDVISRICIYIYIYILALGNSGTNVANGSIRILTLDMTSRIYIQILVIWVPMLQMDRSEY